METLGQTAQVGASSSKRRVFWYICSIHCFGFRDAIERAVLEMMFVYLFMAPFTPENFQQPFQIMKEYSLVYIDISLPSGF